ncbi:MAG TPA: helix-turn-helix transcriptional regulator [Candidatus Tectomicrobia bacterium]
MTRQATDYEIFEKSSSQNRRMLRQERLIFEVTEALSEALAKEGITKVELAERLNKTKGFVSQILAGGRNLTLRTIADVADALGCQIRVHVQREPRLKETAAKSYLPHYGYEEVAWTVGHPVTFELARRGAMASSKKLVRSMPGAA